MKHNLALIRNQNALTIALAKNTKFKRLVSMIGFTEWRSTSLKKKEAGMEKIIIKQGGQDAPIGFP